MNSARLDSLHRAEQHPDLSDSSRWAQQQRAWLQTLIHPSATLPWSNWQGGVRDVGAAGAVYINNVRAHLINALCLTYPAVHMVLGQPNFASLVVAGLQRYPPTSGNLADYGDWLPKMLTDDCAWLAELEWSLDVARRDDSSPAWTWQQASRDMHSPAWLLAHTRLRSPWRSWRLSQEQLALLLQVAVQLQAEWLSTSTAEQAPVALIQQGTRLLLVPEAELNWFEALESGACIESATQYVLTEHPQWQPGAVLEHSLRHGLLQPLSNYSNKIP